MIAHINTKENMQWHEWIKQLFIYINNFLEFYSFTKRKYAVATWEREEELNLDFPSFLYDPSESWGRDSF
jgi:hypothetical protein